MCVTSAMRKLRDRPLVPETTKSRKEEDGNQQGSQGNIETSKCILRAALELIDFCTSPWPSLQEAVLQMKGSWFWSQETKVQFQHSAHFTTKGIGTQKRKAAYPESQSKWWMETQYSLNKWVPEILRVEDMETGEKWVDSFREVHKVKTIFIIPRHYLPPKIILLFPTMYLCEAGFSSTKITL